MSNSFVLLCEGFEEVLSNAVSAVGQKLTHDKDVSFNKLFLSEEAFDNFIGGASSTINVVRTNETYDDQTALTTNDPKAEKREGYNNYIDPDRFVEGLWDDGKSRIKNDTAENVEKIRLESIESLSDDDIIRKAKEYLRSPEGQRDKRPYLRHRPSFGKNQEQIVYDNGKNIFGNVYDPSGAKVPWDPSKPRKGQWDMGHMPGQKYSVVHARYVNEMMTPMEFVQWYRDPKNYRPELPSTNRSHKYE